MNAIMLLKEGHQRVRELFEAFDRCGFDDATGRSQVAQRLIDELGIHSSQEEAIFYPALREIDLETEALGAFEEHHLVRFLLCELNEMDATSEQFVPRVLTLRKLVMQHVDEEESLILPRADLLGQARLREMGEQMKALEEKLRASPGGLRVTMAPEAPIETRRT